MNKFLQIENILLTYFPFVIITVFCTELYLNMLFPASLVLTSMYLYCIITAPFNNYYSISGINFLSIPSIAFLSFSIFIAIPSIYIFYTEVGQVRYHYLFSIVSFYFLVPIGFLIGQSFFNLTNSKISHFIIPIINKKSLFNFNLLNQSLIIIIIISVILYILRSSTFPLIDLIKSPGDYLKASLTREESFKLLKITTIEKYLFNWLRNLFLPIIVILNLLISKMKYNKLITFNSSIVLILAILINSITLEKSPVAALFLSIFGMLFLFRDYLKPKHLLFSFLIILSIPISIMALLFWGRPNMVNVIFNSLLNRLFIIPAEVLYQYFEIFPDYHQYLYGTGTNLFSWFFSKGDGTFPLTNYVAKYWWGIEFTSGSANTVFLGNFWAEFGFWGIIFSTIVVGFLLHLLSWMILEFVDYQFNFTYILLSSILLPIFIFNFFSSNITTIFFTRGLLILLFSLVILKIKEKIEIA